MKYICNLFALLLGLILLSCETYDNDPVIEGRIVSKTIDARAQSFTLRITNYSGKPYNHKVQWRIQGIAVPAHNTSATIVDNKLSILPDGATQLSFDWLTCVVPKHQEEIRVSVGENTSGVDRKLAIISTGGKLADPSIIIIQKAEKE